MEKIPEGWATIGSERSSENQIKEPNRPGFFVKQIVQLAPNATYPDGDRRNEAVKQRRAEIEACLDNIEEIGKDLSRAFIDTYAKHGLSITNGVRFYLVGGRLEPKNLFEGSDLNCAFTVVDDSEDTQPRYGEEPKELTDKKQAARKDFFFGPFKDVVARHGFLIREQVEDKLIEAPLLEPKEYGRRDSEFRANNMPAVLVVTTL